MKRFTLVKLILLTVLAGPMTASAIDAIGLAKAATVLNQVGQVMEKYGEIQAMIDAGTIELDVAEPMDNASGKFPLPFDKEGVITPWAEKALNAKAGSVVGAKVGEKAGAALASKIPFAGGFMAGAAKKKSKEMGAVMAIGGWDYIRENSDRSFNKLDDFSVYLHSQFNGTPEYETALGASMAVYPKLEQSHRASVDRAYKAAKAEARKAAKAAKKAEKAAAKAAAKKNK